MKKVEKFKRKKNNIDCPPFKISDVIWLFSRMKVVGFNFAFEYVGTKSKINCLLDNRQFSLTDDTLFGQKMVNFYIYRLNIRSDNWTNLKWRLYKVELGDSRKKPFQKNDFQNQNVGLKHTWRWRCYDKLLLPKNYINMIPLEVLEKKVEHQNVMKLLFNKKKKNKKILMKKNQSYLLRVMLMIRKFSVKSNLLQLRKSDFFIGKSNETCNSLSWTSTKDYVRNDANRFKNGIVS